MIRIGNIALMAEKVVFIFSLGQLKTFELIKLLTLGLGTLLIKMRSCCTLKF